MLLAQSDCDNHYIDDFFILDGDFFNRKNRSPTSYSYQSVVTKYLNV